MRMKQQETDKNGWRFRYKSVRATLVRQFASKCFWHECATGYFPYRNGNIGSGTRTQSDLKEIVAFLW
jgi:hypothetical protein